MYCRFFAFAISTRCGFSTKGLQVLAKMEHLKELHVNIFSYCGLKTPILVLVEISGLVRNLQRINFPELLEDPENSKIFISKFSQKFPNKRLLMDSLSLDQSFDLKWPPNLTVEKLTLIGPISDKLLETIFCIPPENVRALVFDGVLPSSMYPVVEKFGQSVGHLVVKSCAQSFDRRERQRLNLYRVLAATPSLQKFEFAVPLRLERSPHFDLTPQHFEELTEFKVISEFFGF